MCKVELTRLKQEIIKVCEQRIGMQIEQFQKQLKNLNEALTQEEKSSAGDKHETGRAMIQLDIEKLSAQMITYKAMIENLNRIKLQKTSSVAAMGTMVKTNKALYFLGIALNLIELDTAKVYAISLQSPIGKLLLGKQIGDEIHFRNEKIKIEEMV